MSILIRQRCTNVVRTVIAITVLSCTFGTSRADKIDEEGFKIGRDAMVAHLKVCAGRTMALLGASDKADPPMLGEINNAKFDLEPKILSPADKLNGVEWYGIVKLTWDAYRVLDNGTWTKWFNSGPSFGVRPRIAGFELVSVTLKHGKWEHNDQYIFGSRYFAWKHEEPQPLSCAVLPTP